jgi:hypothetical protein
VGHAVQGRPARSGGRGRGARELLARKARNHPAGLFPLRPRVWVACSQGSCPSSGGRSN